MEIEFLCDDLQREMIECDHRFQIWLCGRRYGKTSTMRIRRVIRALNADHGQIIWYVSPVYARSFKEYEFMMADETFVSNFVKRKRTQPYPAIYLTNGVEIGFRSFERPDTLLGEGLVEVQCDESQKIPERDFWRVLYPMCLDQGGTMLLTGTVRGRNWVWGLHEEAIKGNSSYKSFIRRTEQGPAFQDEQGRNDLANFRAMMPEVVALQELDCVPQAAEDCVFRHLDRALVDVQPSSGPLPGRRYVLALDVGRVKDPCAVLVMDQDGLVVYTEEFPLGQLHEVSAKRAAEIAARWRCQHSCVVDCTKKGDASVGYYDRFIQFYRKHLPYMREFYWSPQHVEETVNNSTLLIEQKRVMIPRVHMALVQQLRIYAYHYNGYHIRFGAPKGEHDDLVACFVMACQAFSSSWFNTTNALPLSVALPMR